MRKQSVFAYAIGICTAVGILAGCSGTGAPSFVGPAGPAAGQAITHPLARSASTLAAAKSIQSATPMQFRTWMSPEAKQTSLMYVSDSYYDVVLVYSWPKLKLLGALTGFGEPQGECVDSAGHIFITNTELQEILEYAHGGTKPIQTLDDPNYYPVGCAIDPKTGDLAASNIFGQFSSEEVPGNVAIFKHASGTAKFKSPAADAAEVYFDGYDNNGNLYTDGVNTSSAYELSEIPYKTKKKVGHDLTVSGATIYFPGAVLWSGKYLVLGDQELGGASASGYYQTSVSGTTANVKASYSLKLSKHVGAPACDVVQFSVVGTLLAGSDLESADCGPHYLSSADSWTYASTSPAVKSALGPAEPVGSAVSP